MAAIIRSAIRGAVRSALSGDEPSDAPTGLTFVGARDNEVVSTIDGGFRATAVTTGAFGLTAEVTGLTPGASYVFSMDITTEQPGATYVRVDNDEDLSTAVAEEHALSETQRIDLEFTAPGTTAYVGAISVAPDAGATFNITNAEVTPG